MKISLQDLYKGFATIIKDKNYFTAKEYIEPFIQKVQDEFPNLICYGKSAEQLSKTSATIQMVYNKVLVIAYSSDKVYQDPSITDTYHRAVCMTYALDVRKPTAKFYTGLVDQNNNFYCFSLDDCVVQVIEPDTALNYTSIPNLINKFKSPHVTVQMVETMYKTVFNQNNMLNILGNWVDKAIQTEWINDSGKIKVSVDRVLDVYQELWIKKDSPHLLKPDDKIIKVYQTFISKITEDSKDLNNRCEKTLIINKILGL